jgi:hypothetical protein
MSKKIKPTKPAETQNTPTDAPAQASGSSKKTTTRPGKKVISMVVDEKWAARVALCAKALGQNQSEYIVGVVSKHLKSHLAAALDQLRAEVE